MLFAFQSTLFVIVVCDIVSDAALSVENGET